MIKGLKVKVIREYFGVLPAGKEYKVALVVDKGHDHNGAIHKRGYVLDMEGRYYGNTGSAPIVWDADRFEIIQDSYKVLTPVQQHADEIARIIAGGRLVEYERYNPTCARIVCKSGVSFSVQASVGHYCNPRCNTGPWTEVEVGFPSHIIREFEPYMEVGSTDPLHCVYPYTPVEVLGQVIAQCGGLSHYASSERIVKHIEGAGTLP